MSLEVELLRLCMNSKFLLAGSVVSHSLQTHGPVKQEWVFLASMSCLSDIVEYK
jgi:hypothetical protein